ncbi:hypothetical protein TrVE_jg6110 [Triparma verrucosa]|uniref:Uncharacterized protein n=1 Tax=Triparma verrucosa TaxID=1606542 RepID=A0A9W7BR94_9STRA|nr:hypothetical protein TrVE_jg6110 [Triparma verrucosa]
MSPPQIHPESPLHSERESEADSDSYRRNSSDGQSGRFFSSFAHSLRKHSKPAVPIYQKTLEDLSKNDGILIGKDFVDFSESDLKAQFEAMLDKEKSLRQAAPNSDAFSYDNADSVASLISEASTDFTQGLHSPSTPTIKKIKSGLTAGLSEGVPSSPSTSFFASGMASRNKDRKKWIHYVLTKFEDYTSFRSLLELHPEIIHIFVEILRNKLTLPKECSTQLHDLDEVSARTIGRGLASCLKSRKFIAAGVDQWRLKYPAVSSLAASNRFFIPMIETISAALLKKATWGLIYRVSIGAGISLIDFSSDLLMLVSYFQVGSYFYFQWNLAFIGSCIFIQSLLVMNNRTWNFKVREMWLELILVVTFLKPAVDSWRIAVGKSRYSGNGFANHEILYEQSAMKVIEVVLESIPCCILQLHALLNGSEDIQAVVFLSILCSAASAGYTSTLLCYDYDTQPEKRKKMPNFYGMIPDESSRRAITFCSMMLVSSCLTISRCLCFALLSSISGMYVLAFFFIDQAVFLLSKIFRNDFYYWKQSNAPFATSLFSRMIIKVFADFTSCLQLRHPNELGGAYYSINLVTGQLSCFVAIKIFEQALKAGTVTSALSMDTVYILYVACTVLWFLSFVALLSAIKSSYWHTLFAVKNGIEHNTECFYFAKKKNNYRGILDTLDCNERYLQPFKEDAMAWIDRRWDNWHDNGLPAYLTGAQISSFHESILPERALQDRNENRWWEESKGGSKGGSKERSKGGSKGEEP